MARGAAGPHHLLLTPSRGRRLGRSPLVQYSGGGLVVSIFLAALLAEQTSVI